MKKFISIATSVFFAMASLGYTSWAVSLSETPVKEKSDSIVINKASLTPQNNTERTSIFKSNGKSYALVGEKTAATTSQHSVIKKGSQVLQLDSGKRGSVTGSILIKTNKSIASINVGQHNTTTIGNGFYLLQFSENIDLLPVIKSLHEKYDIEAAEIEVNTKQYKAM